MAAALFGGIFYFLACNREVFQGNLLHQNSEFFVISLFRKLCKFHVLFREANWNFYQWKAFFRQKLCENCSRCPAVAVNKRMNALELVVQKSSFFNQLAG